MKKDKGSLSTIQLETEPHIVEIFGSRSSVGVNLHHMRVPKGGGKYTEAIVQSLRNNGLSIWCFDGLFSSKCDTFFIVDKI